MIYATAIQWDSPAMVDNEAFRLRKRDPDVIAALVARYQHRLYRYLLRLVREPAVAEDLFQQTWLRVVEKATKFDVSRSFEPWLFSLAHNLAVDHLRRSRTESLDEPRQDGVPPIDSLASTELDAFERYLSAERASVLATILCELPAVYREVLTLRFEQDLKLEEIAEITGAPLATAKTRLRRALDGLRQKLESRFRPGEWK